MNKFNYFLLPLLMICFSSSSFGDRTYLCKPYHIDAGVKSSNEYLYVSQSHYSASDALICKNVLDINNSEEYCNKGTKVYITGDHFHEGYKTSPGMYVCDPGVMGSKWNSNISSDILEECRIGIKQENYLGIDGNGNHIYCEVEPKHTNSGKYCIENICKSKQSPVSSQESQRGVQKDSETAKEKVETEEPKAEETKKVEEEPVEEEKAQKDSEGQVEAAKEKTEKKAKGKVASKPATKKTSGNKQKDINDGKEEELKKREEALNKKEKAAEDLKKKKAVIEESESKLREFFKKVDSDRSVWKNADGSFNATRLASDLTAGVVLGTVGGVVSGVLIKKSQVEKGFDALNCTVNGQKVADWGDEFSVGLRR